MAKGIQAQAAARAFMAHRSYSSGNYSTNGRELRLFRNLIATNNNGLKITDAGWDTPTTHRALNALPGVSVYTSKGVQYLNGEKWDGRWKSIRTADLSEGGLTGHFKAVRMAAALGDIMCEKKEDKNAFKSRMIWTIPGIEKPQDWDQLSEEEKERRINGALDCLKEG